MKRRMRIICAACAAVFLTAGCGRVSKEQLARREEGIVLLESGDYEGAVEKFEELIKDAKRVSDFELDVLKYRAEAEFGFGDYEAAAYTYELLNEVDEKRAEYYYFGALSLARAGDTETARERMRSGYALDSKMERPGFEEAMMALGEAFFAQQSYEEAEEVYVQMARAGRGGSEVYLRRMILAMEQGDYKRALSVAAEGLKLPDDTARKELRFHEAVCYEYLGEYKKALEYFQAYVAEFGNDDAANHEILFLETR